MVVGALARAVVAPWGRLALLGVLLGGAALLALAVGPVELVRESLAAEATSPWAGPAFLALYALGTVAFVPKPALSVAAGVLFGAGYGLALATLGTVLGALLGFWAGRALGREALLPVLRSRRLAGLERRLTERAFGSVLLARLLPVLPFAVVNLGAAVSRMRWAPFAAATALGTAPGNAVWVLAGASVAAPSASWLWLPAVGVGLPLAWAALRRRRAGHSADPAPTGGLPTAGTGRCPGAEAEGADRRQAALGPTARS
ncbi:VTT domain-containing protein [Streptomyces sp. DSM 44915]|uniref:TVP38/TMEM64 family membrane protein n=1 Tax=Streptomyces chisholmiae TaxID=3075540 RepID=A0ABU2JWR1_9ACTN|nr:VTT domain-containing protein [Streptomyces sp. DSM 44915]MDT0269448.1 VTT domain-containing protein [Streptomyces sp. DSM 44915]